MSDFITCEGTLGVWLDHKRQLSLAVTLVNPAGLALTVLVSREPSHEHLLPSTCQLSGKVP